MSKFGDFFTALKKNSAAKNEGKKKDEQSERQKGESDNEDAKTQSKTGENAKPKEQSGVSNQTPEFRGRTINRKLVFGLSGICVAAFLVSFLSFSQHGQKPQQQSGRLETSERNATEDLTYSNLAQKDRQAAGQNPNRAPGMNNAQNSGANPPRQTAQGQQATVPRSYSAENVPRQSSGNNMTIAQVPNENAQAKKEAKAQADALTAAISFALGGNPATGAGESGAKVSAKSDVMQTAAARQTPVENALYAGTLLPAMLMSGVSSDLGGQLMAQVTQDVYDSLNGDTLLIPMGSRLIGQYETGAENGQSRVAVNWSMLILPDGSSYNIDGKLTSADGAGYPGIPGDVDGHEGKILTGGALSSAIAALGSIAVGNTGSGDDESAGNLAMEGASANLLNSASALFNKNLNIKPTITVPPGAAFSIRVNQTLVLEPYW